MSNQISELERQRDACRQRGQARDEAITLLYLAEARRNDGDWDGAERDYKDSIGISSRLGDRELESIARGSYGEALLDSGRPSEASLEFRAAASICSELQDTPGLTRHNGNLAIALRQQGRTDEAIPLFLEVVRMKRELGEDRLTGQWLANLAVAYRDVGDVSAARDALGEAQQIAVEHNDLAGRAQCLILQGTLACEVGDLEGGAEYFLAGLRICREQSDQRAVAILLVDLGTALSGLQQTERARAHLEEARRVAEQTGDRRLHARALIALAQACRDAGDRSGANGALTKALGLAEACRDQVSLIDGLSSLGLLLLDTDSANEARERFTEALSLARERGDDAAAARLLVNRGRAHLALSSTQDALDDFEAGLELARDTRNPEAEWRALWGRGDSHAYGLSDWERALESYREAIAVIERGREALTLDALRLTGLSDKAEVYRQTVVAALQTLRFDEALTIAELGKARHVADLLSRGEVVPSGLPSDVARAYQDSRDSVQARWRECMEDSGTGTVTHGLGLPGASPDCCGEHGAEGATGRSACSWDAYRAARAELDEALTLVREYDPGFRALDTAEPLSADAILKLAPEQPGSALVLLVVANDGTAAFIIQEHKARLEPSDVVWIPSFDRSKAAELILSMPSGGRPQGRWYGIHQLLASEPNQVALDRMTETADELSKRLFAPLGRELHSRGLNRIILVPQGVLHMVPPDMMRYQTGGESRLLLDEFTISLAPSATVLRSCRKKLRSRKSKRRLLAVCFDEENEYFGLEEAEDIASLFDSDSVVLSGREAKGDEVLRHLPGSTHVHFACHGRYSWRRPDRSHILLADGPLTLRRIQDEADLSSAALVTLSACETSIADPVGQADEYLGLVSAFLVAGAPTVIGNLWAVEDRSSAVLTTELYHHIVRGEEQPAVALRAAKRWLRGSFAPDGARKWAHPYYWAPFVCAGA